jgi:RNA polymerase sigma-70 factor (ECF subfamily)
VAVRQRESLPENLPDSDEGPAEQAAQRESLALLADAIHSLPAEFRAAFLLRVEEGLSFRQIASILHLTEETARWRVFKARQKLLRTLTPPLEQEKP